MSLGASRQCCQSRKSDTIPDRVGITARTSAMLILHVVKVGVNGSGLLADTHRFSKQSDPLNDTPAGSKLTENKIIGFEHPFNNSGHKIIFGPWDKVNEHQHPDTRSHESLTLFETRKPQRE
jgi:hypothetical protein